MATITNVENAEKSFKLQRKWWRLSLWLE